MVECLRNLMLSFNHPNTANQPGLTVPVEVYKERYKLRPTRKLMRNKINQTIAQSSSSRVSGFPLGNASNKF